MRNVKLHEFIVLWHLMTIFVKRLTFSTFPKHSNFILAIDKNKTSYNSVNSFFQKMALLEKPNKTSHLKAKSEVN